MFLNCNTAKSLFIRPAILFIWILLAERSFAQPLAFTNITTWNGLSDNFIKSLAVDKDGFLWIGTNEGLNIYDGYSITQLPADEHPEIPGKSINHMLCDSHNRVWLASYEGVGWADEKRNFHRVLLPGGKKEFKCPVVFETESYGVVLDTEDGQFYFDSTANQWKKIDWIPAALDIRHFADESAFDENRILLASDSAILLVNYHTHKIEFGYEIKRPASVCRVHDQVIAIASETNILYFIDINTGNIIRTYDFSTYSDPPLKGRSWVEVRMGADGNLLYASSLWGFFIIDKKGSVTRYVHEPTNNLSIGANKVYRVIGLPNGDIAVGTDRYGVSIANILKKQAGYNKFFIDSKGNYFDGYLDEFISDTDGSYWLGASDRLIHWNRHTGISVFYQHHSNDSLSYLSRGIYRLCRDRKGRLWISLTGGEGLALFNEQKGKFDLVIPVNTRNVAAMNRHIYDITLASDGRLWMATPEGIYNMDPDTRTIDTITWAPLLRAIGTMICSSVAEDNQQRIWVTTSGKGLFCFDKKSGKLINYRKKDGLIDDVCLDLMIASDGTVYVTMFKGFNMIRPNGEVIQFTKHNGLRFDKTDAFLEDNNKTIWFSNSKCIVRFDPVTLKMDFFDDHENLNIGGFKNSSAFKSPDGELLWGTQSGINYFYPDQLKNVSDPLHISIYKFLAGDSSFTGETKKDIRIRYRDNYLQFYFVAINLKGSRNIRYQYKLEGFDKNWLEGTDIKQARYTSLSPGHYRFKVKASSDRINWVDASNEIAFYVVTPFYMTWWFKTMIGLLIAGGLFYFSSRRNRDLRRKKEELETEKAIHHFASSMGEHQTEDDILWDVARNCIGRLQFEDCVIYILKPETGLLVQKAAHGPKSPRNFEITRPMDIPLGKGIVGTVAFTGKAELIRDTTKDKRYIIDDEMRYSEISVPMISGGKVLGVIDCEHSKKRFFTQKHLSILTTIASLCANKIIRARTEEEKKHTEHMLAETKQKMTEAEMQALRAQMNPHFIFNCLNSINRYIVKSDQATASLYLTRFAKLIRLILDNSNSKNIILSNELEALKLYIEMESLRFENKFTFSIIKDKSLQADSIDIPPLIIQPYVENAIWHGLLHRSGGGHLSIHLSMATANMLQCIIEDNGVGREKATELKSKSATSKKSLGMELTENRLLLLNKYARVHSSVEIVDLKDDQYQAAGTKVILKIPVGE